SPRNTPSRLLRGRAHLTTPPVAGAAIRVAALRLLLGHTRARAMLPRRASRGSRLAAPARSGVMRCALATYTGGRDVDLSAAAAGLGHAPSAEHAADRPRGRRARAAGLGADARLRAQRAPRRALVPSVVAVRLHVHADARG